MSNAWSQRLKKTKPACRNWRSILRLILAELDDTQAKVCQIEAKLRNGIATAGSAGCL